MKMDMKTKEKLKKDIEGSWERFVSDVIPGMGVDALPLLKGTFYSGATVVAMKLESTKEEAVALAEYLNNEVPRQED
jgi:hypothetical protein